MTVWIMVVWFEVGVRGGSSSIGRYISKENCEKQAQIIKKNMKSYEEHVCIEADA